jgi:TATA-binding protein-associated factor
MVHFATRWALVRLRARESTLPVHDRSHGQHFHCSIGKTLQALIAIALSHDDNPDDEVLTVSLIVCPSTVVGHWMTEIAKFFPESSVLRPICYAGTKAQRESLWKRVGSSANVVVTSYAVLRTDVDILTEPIYRTCTLDEGHLLKNPKTGQYV